MERTLAEFLTHAPVLLRRDDGVIIYWSVGCQELYGYTADEAVGQVSHTLLQTVFATSLKAIEGTLEKDGEWRGRLQHTRKDGERLWVESLWRLRYADRPAARVVIEQNTDVTDRVHVERHREILTRELDHRVKNTLSVVQGIARLTFGRAEKALVEAFEQRLAALSEAHNLLTRERWAHAELGEVLREVMRALHVEDRVHADGETVNLNPAAAVAYSLAFHELATNAMKYGSLSVLQGRVNVVWRTHGPAEADLSLTWTERGGPAVKPPTREGFGTRLIRRAISAELNTPVQFHFEEEGFVCEFDGPVQKAPMGAIPSASEFDLKG